MLHFKCLSDLVHSMSSVNRSPSSSTIFPLHQSFHPDRKKKGGGVYYSVYSLYFVPLNTPCLTTVIGKLSVKATELSSKLA